MITFIRESLDKFWLKNRKKKIFIIIIIVIAIVFVVVAINLFYFILSFLFYLEKKQTGKYYLDNKKLK